MCSYSGDTSDLAPLKGPLTSVKYSVSSGLFGSYGLPFEADYDVPNSHNRAVILAHG